MDHWEEARDRLEFPHLAFKRLGQGKFEAPDGTRWEVEKPTDKAVQESLVSLFAEAPVQPKEEDDVEKEKDSSVEKEKDQESEEYVPTDVPTEAEGPSPVVATSGTAAPAEPEVDMALAYQAMLAINRTRSSSPKQTPVAVPAAPQEDQSSPTTGFQEVAPGDPSLLCTREDRVAQRTHRGQEPTWREDVRRSPVAGSGIKFSKCRCSTSQPYFGYDSCSTRANAVQHCHPGGERHPAQRGPQGRSHSQAA